MCDDAYKARNLVLRMYEGYRPTDEEKRFLSGTYSLDLSGTSIDSTECLSDLTNLNRLSLADTQVKSLEGLRCLTRLQSLDLSGTPIDSLDCLSSLKYLANLDISGTSLKRLPQCLVDKGLLFLDNRCSIEFFPAVFMKDVRLFEQPVALFFQPHEAIKACYKEEQTPVDEAKVIFLGDVGVGKTHTLETFRHSGEESDPASESTPGVCVVRYAREERPTINFWDFGVREIERSTYRYFLTERACYVAVVSNRYPEITEQARRWLKIIEKYAPDSKVILAANRWEGARIDDLDASRLKEEFSNLVEIVEYTATDSNDAENLARSIEKEVDALPGAKMKFPKSWLEIMNELRAVPNGYITKKGLRRICRKFGLESDDVSAWLVERFCEFGVCSCYYQDVAEDSCLRNFVLLNPNWLTNALSTIIEVGAPLVQDGRITREKLIEILSTSNKYRSWELNYVLGITRKFHLSYDAGDGEEFISALLPDEVSDYSNENEE